MKKKKFINALEIIGAMAILLVLFWVSSPKIEEEIEEEYQDGLVDWREAVRDINLNEDAYNRPTLYVDDIEYHRIIQKENDQHIVRATVYNPEEEQCGSDPFTTADGRKIDLNKLQAGELKWIAVSQDLLKYYKFGEKVYVYVGEGNQMNGFYTIHDTMSSKIRKSIDILMPSNVRTGTWNNVLISKTHDVNGKERMWN